MSEMLGNRYFLARQFDKAIPYLEKALARNPEGDKIKKKLILCFIQTGQIERAFGLFSELIKKNPNIIIDTDIYYDDCPCNELIPEWEQKAQNSEKSLEYLETLAMLHLYCNVKKSRHYLEEACRKADNPDKILTVMNRLPKV